MNIAAVSPLAPPLLRSSAKSRTDTRQIMRVAALFIAHVALAIGMRSVTGIATAHALATLAVGLVVAATTKQIRQVSCVVAYIVGSEVLWRMNKAAIPWEFGKYAIAAVMLCALVRMQARRNRALAIAYIALLLPSAALTFMTLDLDGARQEASFYLACPFALAVAVLFYSNARLSPAQLRATFVALVAPVVGIAALSFSSTVGRDDLIFVNASNLATSGGFGPNQVSAVLGLGVLCLILLSFDGSLTWSTRIPLLALAAAFAMQAALTFARGGLILAFAGAAAALFFLIKNRGRGRAAVVVIAVLSLGIGKYIIEPQLDSFTEGKLSARYASTKASGRNDYVLSELAMFADNPVLGVGPGVGVHLRTELDLFAGSSHTEYTRMLAEHGVLGLLSMACLIALAVRAIRSANQSTARAVASAMVIWTLLFLLINGTRIAAPAFAFGLAFGVPVLAKQRRAVLDEVR